MRRIPPPILLVACVAIVFLGQFYFPEYKLAFGPLQILIAAFLLLGGMFVARAAGLQFSQADTTINPVDIDKASALVTDGVFKYSRNPMYVGLMAILTSIVLFFGFWPGLALIIGLFIYLNHWQIAPEEEVLAQKFGQDYADYKARVRRWV